MLTDVIQLRTALKRGDYRGVILYEGPSLLDGSPIVVIANRITNASNNAKTGDMVQSFIIRSDVDPLSALASGQDSAICGNCPHRPFTGGKCYVQVGKSVMSVWKAYNKGRYARAGVDFDKRLLPQLFEGLAFRAGTYGDPAAAPFMVWRHATIRAAFVNGYTHQWRDPRFAVFRNLCMASADSVVDRDEAHAAGWRTFRVRSDMAALERGLEIVCPASKEAGQRVNCAACKACGGTSAKVKASIAIVLHGPRVGNLKLAA
jgi:hypothetical protein